ncbi:sialidase family protein [Mastigocoleus testarum]|uniref:S-layer protein n=1 Tax=Mastigocoleus testarum BC008 TaxID=371196 RepID=A0A0V7ZLS6_9CYAN|nr:sialidase family protein [Mastigocoleus testarum]KST65441.1 S-layer protein [Mastigocoleus testarum BC008]
MDSSNFIRTFLYSLRRISFLFLSIFTALILIAWNNSILLSASSNPINNFHWRSVNIQGMGYVTGLVVSPSAPYDVYIRTDVGGAYRFDRDKNRWLPLMDMFDSSFSGGGVGVESVAIDPQKNGRVYAAINRRNRTFDDNGKLKYKYSGEVMVSDNRGKTWRSSNLGSKNIFVGPNEAYRSDTGERLAADPNQEGLVYFASRRDGLWRWDGKSDWQQVSGGLPDPSSLPKYKKSDGKINKKIPGFTFVAFDQSTRSRNQPTQTIYVGVHGSGMWQSRDAGKSWNNIVGEKNPLRGVVASDGTLYVSFGSRGKKGKKSPRSLKKYQQGKWTDISPDGNDKVYSSVTVQENQPNVVMAVSGKYVYRSQDGGKNWRKQTMEMSAKNKSLTQDVNTSAPAYYHEDASSGAAAIFIDPGNPKQVWWTNGWGVARTDDVTTSTPDYKWLMENLEELDANMVRVPPKPKDEGGADLLSAVHDTIGFRHVERYQVPNNKINPINLPINPDFKWANPKWQHYPTPFPHVAGATGMDYAYKKPDYAAFVGFHQWQGNWPVHGITNDNGKTWTAFPSIPEENVWKSDGSEQYKAFAIGGQIAMSPTNPQNMVWAPTWGTWPHYTKDGGRTWKLAFNLDHPPRPDDYDPKNNDRAHYEALPKAWSNTISPWLSSYILAADRQDPKGETFYYFSGSTFFYSNDGGFNWRKGADSGFPNWLIRPTIVSNPTQQGDVWMSFARNPEDVNGNKLYHSSDGGRTFNTVSSVDTCEFITFGKGKSDQQPYMYIFGRVNGATKDAIYKSENMGKNWIKISDPERLQFPGLTWLEGDMRTPNLVYAALTGRGIMVGETLSCQPQELSLYLHR